MSPNPYEDETLLGPNSYRDSEPCDCLNESDEEHAANCIFWRPSKSYAEITKEMEPDGDIPF